MIHHQVLNEVIHEIRHFKGFKQGTNLTGKQEARSNDRERKSEGRKHGVPNRVPKSLKYSVMSEIRNPLDFTLYGFFTPKKVLGSTFPPTST